METIHTSERNKLPGNTILHLVTITPNNETQTLGTRMSTKEIMAKLVFGDGLRNGEQLIIDGQDAYKLLPRPEAYGNNRLALMAALDSMSPDSEMALRIDTADVPSVAAD